MNLKLIVALLVVVGLAGLGAWWRLRSKAVDPAAAAATAPVAVTRGPLVASVATTGRVVANLDVEIKCKASGEIVELPYDVSDTVKKGELLMRLDPVDENRLVSQAQVALDSARARQAQAEVNQKIAKLNLETERKRATAALASAEARAKDTQAKAERQQQLLAKGLCSPEECETAGVAAVQASADLSQAQVRMEELAIEEEALELKQQDVNLAKAQVTSNEIDLAQAQQRLTDTRVLAPLDGVVTSRGVQVGQIISSGINNVGGGTTVMTVSDLSRLFVLASVDESQIGQVQTEMPVEITVDAYPQARFSGRVTRIAAQGVTVSNVVTFEVKLEVLDRASAPGAAARGGRGGRRGGARAEPTSGGAGSRAGGEGSPSGRPSPAPPPAGGEAGTGTANGPPRSKARLMPEMTANVTITLDQRDDALQVPVEAVWRNKGQRLVEVQLANGKTEERPVEIGITDGVMQEITDGLKEGEQVVIRKNRTESRWRGGGGRGGPGLPMMH